VQEFLIIIIINVCQYPIEKLHISLKYIIIIILYVTITKYSLDRPRESREIALALENGNTLLKLPYKTTVNTHLKPG